MAVNTKEIQQQNFGLICRGRHRANAGCLEVVNGRRGEMWDPLKPVYISAWTGVKLLGFDAWHNR